MANPTPESIDQAIRMMREIGTDTSDIEVKSAADSFPKDALRSISAFANTSGGIIVLGLSEKDGFKPVEGFDAKKMSDALANACRTQVTPPVNASIHIIEVDERPVVAAYIPEISGSEKPCYVTRSHMYDGSYLRVGDGDRKMTEYEVDRFRESHRQPVHDLEVVEGATIDDLDASQVSALLSRERFLNPLVFAKLDDEAALKALRVVREDDAGVLRPTIAGLFSLGVYPQEFFPCLGVTFVAFPGTRAVPFGAEQRYLDSCEIGGSIPVMVAEVLRAVERNTSTAAVVEGAFRRDVPEYPQEALREAVANALMHRDYSASARGGQVQINLYRDCIEITNPGGLFGGVTVDMLGTPGVSATRNQFLSKLLSGVAYPYELGGARYVVENKGTGYIEIERSLAERGMRPPQAYDSPARFTLVIERGQRRRASGDAVEEAILSLAEANGSVSAKEAQEAAGVSRATVLNRINKLIGEGRIVPTEEGITKNRRYMLESR